MENGAFTSCGFDKKSSSNSGFVRSMNSISTQVPPSFNNLGRSFVDGGGCSSLGPTTNSGGANDVPNIYRDNVSSSSSRGGATNLQAFHIFPSSYYTVPFKSPGGEMGFPFTAAQWKELERQAMIYKCMVSSVPVPPHLLSPLSTNSCVSSSYSSGRYGRNGDPEPGRCKRTDGKKWRCAREVAPHQKYCERHLHRGRPRSRKPVELKNDTHKKQTKSQPSVPATEQQPLIFFNTKTDLSISSPYYKPPNRELGMTVTEGEMEPPWENMIEPNLSLENCYFPQQYVEQQPLNLFSYPHFPAPEIDLPSGFIDAWSIDNLNTRNNEPTISLNEGGDLSPSLNLSMAMAAGNIVDREMRNIQNDHKTKDSIWLTPVSWEPFARGGPLGEALQPVGGSNPSTPATTVSSPSGVLHWTLFSQSDSSVCNSPTFVAPPSEVSNQWLN